jgi:hypothetical protein
MLPHEIRQDEEASSNLEASLSAKEKIISELHLELRNVENALSKEREEHLLESKRLNTLVNEKEAVLVELQGELSERPTAKQVEDLRKQVKILQVLLNFTGICHDSSVVCFINGFTPLTSETHLGALQLFSLGRALRNIWSSCCSLKLCSRSGLFVLVTMSKGM